VEWKAKEIQNDAQDWGKSSRPFTPSDGGWGVSMDDKHWVEWSASDSKVSISYLPLNHGGPSMEGGVKVAIEVFSSVTEPVSGCSTCRSLMIIDCLSVPDLLSSLCHSTIVRATLLT
jgi:hypothetical protein